MDEEEKNGPKIGRMRGRKWVKNRLKFGGLVTGKAVEKLWHKVVEKVIRK